jgi:type IX secretion system substrate protein
MSTSTPKKAIIQSILSVGVLGFFLLIAVGSVENQRLLALLGFDIEPYYLFDPETDNYEHNLKWNQYERNLFYPKDKYGRPEGKFKSRNYYSNDESGDTVIINETGVMLEGLRYGPCQTQYLLVMPGYAHGIGRITRYYIAGIKVPKEDYEYWLSGGDLPYIEYKKSQVTDNDATAWERLGERYPWFVFQVMSFGFDSLCQERYLDTLELILQENTFGEDEFDDYYDYAIEDLNETPYDSIIQVNTLLSYLQGMDLVLGNEFRMAVLDSYYMQDGNTYDMVAENYPGYLDMMVTEGEVPEADFELFCEKLDSAMNSYGLLDLEDPFFIDSVDGRIYRALFAIMGDIEEPELKSSVTLYSSESFNPSLVQRVHSLIAREQKSRSEQSTPEEVAEVVLFTIVMAYFDGDLMKESVKASWLAKNGIASPPEALTSFYKHENATSVTLLGYVYSDGGSDVSERGIAWAQHNNPTLDDQHGSMGTGTGFFKLDVTGLTEGEGYYARAYATNAEGTSYGNCIIFTAEESSGTGISDHGMATLSIYPNPAASFVSLSCPPAESRNCRVQITDMDGRVHLDMNADGIESGGRELLLDVRDLKDGSYICRLQLDSGKTYTARLLIVH